MLAALLAVVHLQLWFSDSGRPYVVNLEQQLVAQRNVNAQARERNERLEAEVGDLREGLEMVEEKARGELGMIKPHEVFVQVMPASR
jgi:cell division protein FtsB